MAVSEVALGGSAAGSVGGVDCLHAKPIGVGPPGPTNVPYPDPFHGCLSDMGAHLSISAVDRAWLVALQCLTWVHPWGHVASTMTTVCLGIFVA